MKSQCKERVQRKISSYLRSFKNNKRQCLQGLKTTSISSLKHHIAGHPNNQWLVAISRLTHQLVRIISRWSRSRIIR
jgi:hypothetical protein